MRTIALINSKMRAIVSDRDFKLVSKYRWKLMKSGYAYCQPKKEEYGSGPRPTYLLHRLVMGFPKFELDHKDRNKLNCARSNLRKCTPSQNLANRGKLKTNTTGYLGVYLDKRTGKFIAKMRVNKKNLHIGVFDSPVAAAKARDAHARKHHRQFAYVNFSGGSHF